MGRRLAAALLLLALGVPPAVAAPPEEAVIAPAASADRDAVERIRRMVDAIRPDWDDATRLSLFARMPDGRLVAVEDNDSWPDGLDMAVILRRGGGRVTAMREIPTSESGDWSTLYTHYFDADGRTVFFERHSSFYNAGCTDLARETSGYVFAAMSGVLLAKTYRLTDRDGRVIGLQGCDFPYRHAYDIAPSWSEAAARYPDLPR